MMNLANINHAITILCMTPNVLIIDDHYSEFTFPLNVILTQSVDSESSDDDNMIDNNQYF